MVVVPFRKVPSFAKAHAHGTDSLPHRRFAPFHLLLWSTSSYLPALAYASDRHVTDVICVMSCQSLVCHIDLLHLNIHGNFIPIEINLNPDDISNNNLILPIFCQLPSLIYY